LPKHWEKIAPIDACEVSGVQSYYAVGSKDKYHITINFWNGDSIESPQIKEAKYYDYKNAKKELNHIQFLIYDALNAPVLATEEVLAGLPKDAKAVASTQGKSWFECECHNNYWMKLGIETLYLASLNDWVSLLDKDWHIKANGCPKTAEYLRQFTLDGKRKETKDV
jgi:hypothetical protein